MKNPAPKPAPTLDRILEELETVHHKTDAIVGQMEHAEEAVRNEQRLENTIRELEARVANDAMKAARMEGYLDRVAEEDQLRAGFVHVEQPPEVRPARQGRRHFGAHGSSVASGAPDVEGRQDQAARWQEVKPMRRFRYTE